MPHKPTITLKDVRSLVDKKGWKVWSRKIEGWIIDHGHDVVRPEIPEDDDVPQVWEVQYDGAVRGDELTPEQVQENVETRKEFNDKRLANVDWIRGQILGVNSIRDVCGPRAYTLVKNLENIREAMDVLEKEFKPAGESSFGDVWKTWSELKMDNFQNLEEMNTAWEELYEELYSINDYTQTRLDLVMKFKTALPDNPAWDQWRSIFAMQYDPSIDPTVTLEVVRNSALKEESQIRDRQSHQQPLGFAARQAPVHPSQQWNHQSSQTSSQPNNNGKRPYEDKSLDPERCDTCGGLWHTSITCWDNVPGGEAKWEKENPFKARQRRNRRDMRASAKRNKSSRQPTAMHADGPTTSLTPGTTYRTQF